MSKPENNTDCTALIVVVIFRYFWFKSLLSFEPSDACTFCFFKARAAYYHQDSQHAIPCSFTSFPYYRALLKVVTFIISFLSIFLTPLLTATFHLTWKQLDTKWKQHDYLLPIKIYKHLFLTCSSHTPLGLLSLAMPFLSNHSSVTTNNCKQAGNFNTISQHRKYWVLYRAMTSYLKHYFTRLVL